MRLAPNKLTHVYLGVTLALSSVAWTLIIWSGHLDMGFGVMIPAIMWCPGLAALVTCRLLRRDLGSIGWRWPKNSYIAAAYFVPLAYTSVAYGIAWGFRLAGWNSEFVHAVAESVGLNGLPVWASFTLGIIFMATGGVIQNLSMTLGEEIGWRGLLLPELAKHISFTKASLLSGIIWAAWHYPLLLFADYNVGTSRWYALICSTVTCISISVILAWFRLKSESVWPAALLHACHNLFVPIIFDNLTRNTGPTLWYTSVFGAALPITSAVFAVYFWMRRTEIPPTTTQTCQLKPKLSQSASALLVSKIGNPGQSLVSIETHVMFDAPDGANSHTMIPTKS